MLFGCKHKWKHIKDEVFDEKLSNTEFSFDDIGSSESSMKVNEHTAGRDSSIAHAKQSIALSLAKRGVISVQRCELCGKIKHTKTIL